MTPIEKFKADLKADKTLIGSAITFTDPLVTEALADSVDFLWVDLEHSTQSIDNVGRHLLACRARQTPGLVRVTGVGTGFIKPVLDAGADGIVVPQIRSAEEVRAVVADCRYPPRGRRGLGPRVSVNYGRTPTTDYVRFADQNLFVSIQVETAEAVESIDDIVAVDGLDSIVIGPWDLSASLGVLGEIEHPKVVGAMELVIAKAREAGLFVGAGMGVDADYACTLNRRGVQWLQVGGDFSYLIMTIDEVTRQIRERCG